MRTARRPLPELVLVLCTAAAAACRDDRAPRSAGHTRSQLGRATAPPDADAASAAPGLRAQFREACAPWGGPAVTIEVFTGASGGCSERAAAIVLTVWRNAVPLRAGAQIEFEAEQLRGQITDCRRGPNDCVPLDVGTLWLDVVELEELRGRYRVSRSDGSSESASFTAHRCPGQPFCG